MPYASENIGTPGVTGSGGMHADTGLGFGLAHRRPTGPLQPEHVRARFMTLGVQLGNLFRPMLQIPVLTRAWDRVRSAAPGQGAIVPGVPTHESNAFFETPQHIRPAVQNSEEERRAYREALVAGSLYQPSADPEQRGTMIEHVRDRGMIFGEDGSGLVTFADDVDPQPVINTPDTGTTDQAAELVQDPHGNVHRELRSRHGNFPYLPIDQLPMVARSVVLGQIAGAGSFIGEIDLPDGTVDVRITWTNSAIGVNAVDLWCSSNGAVVVPNNANQPSIGGFQKADPRQDGVFLNPDSSTRYNVKGKRAINFAATGQTTVNVQCYMQN